MVIYMIISQTTRTWLHSVVLELFNLKDPEDLSLNPTEYQLVFRTKEIRKNKIE